MPRAIRVTDWKAHTTNEKVAASLWLTPYRVSAKVTARFHGPRPPLLGMAMLHDPKTNTTNPGTSPHANPGWVISSRVKGKAQKQM